MSHVNYYDELIKFDDRKNDYKVNFKTMPIACKMLTDEELGAVMRAHFEYAYARVTPVSFAPDQFERADFMNLVLQLFVSDEDAYYQSYIHVCEQNSKNQKKRWQKSKHNPQNHDTSVYESIPSNTNYTDKDIDKDMDKDMDKDKDKEMDAHDLVTRYATELEEQGIKDATMFVSRYIQENPHLQRDWRRDFKEYVSVY